MIVPHNLQALEFINKEITGFRSENDSHERGSMARSATNSADGKEL
jgi:hypothetical protein